MTDIKIGDRVRVTFEGETILRFGSGSWCVKANDGTHRPIFPDTDTIEVFSPPLKVGDTVKSVYQDSTTRAIIVAIVEDKAWVKSDNNYNSVWALAALVKVES